MSARPRAVVFDLDGTLVDSMPFVLEAFAHAAEPFGASLSPDEWRARMGGPPDRILRTLLEHPAQVVTALERLDRYTRGHWQKVAAFAGMQSLVRDLIAQGTGVAVWTGRDRESAEAILLHHAILTDLGVLVCGDDLPSHKPDPEGLKSALHRLRVQPEEALLVGDAEVDVLAGAALGVRTLFITHGLTVDTRISAQAWKVVNQPAEAYALMRQEVMVT